MTNNPFPDTYLTWSLEDTANKSKALRKNRQCGEWKDFRFRINGEDFFTFAICEQNPIICLDQGCSYESLTTETVARWILESSISRDAVTRSETKVSDAGLGLTMYQTHGDYGSGL